MILKENILLKVTEKEIMEYYWGEHLIENKPIYKNPTRGDNTGKCYFKWYGNKFMLVDRALSKENNLDCFDYVMFLYGCNFYEALKRINNDMMLSTIKKLKPVKKGFNKILKNKKRTNFKIKTRDWNKLDKEYWGQYGISITNVNKICKPVYSYKSDSGSVSFRLKYKYNNDLCYVYLFNKSKVKLYQPYSDFSKWRSNTSINDIFGYNQLPHFGNELYIASGGKDMLCLWEMGFNSIAPQSESVNIPDNIMNDLKCRFKNIYYIYDNDETGIKMANKFAEEHNVKRIILPSFKECKDVADFCKEVGILQSKIIINGSKDSNGCDSTTRATAINQ